MTHQTPVTLRGFVRDGELEDVKQALLSLRARGVPSGVAGASALAGVHFARLFVLEPVEDLSGQVIPASVVYMADVDGSADRHFRLLARHWASTVDEVLRHCVDGPSRPSEQSWLEWFRAHQVRSAARYDHTVGRTVEQITGEARLRTELENFVDSLLDAGLAVDAADVHRRASEHVARRPELRWALHPSAGPGVVDSLREGVQLLVGLAVVSLALPVLLPVAGCWLVLIRIMEMFDRQEAGPPSQAHLDAVRTYEDRGAQNPFTAVGFVKPGPVRRLTMKTALLGLDFANRHVFARDNLAGVRTIHFARWVPIDDGRRLIFASSYDGSLESYMDDFISRLALGINLVFSNGAGFPRTRWLLFGGARDEISYKHYLRRNMVPTLVYYSAYPTLSASNVDTNSAVRSGLTPGGTDPATWVRRL